MNILHLIESSEPGGAETVLLSMAQGLRDSGHSSVVLLLEPGWLYEQLKQSAFPAIVVDQGAVRDLRCLRTLSRVIRQFRIDVIHSHEFMMNTYGSLVGLCEGVPIVSTVHGKIYYPLKRRRRLACRMVSRLSTMVAVSDDLKRFLTQRVGIASDRITTIHNGIHCAPFEHPPSEMAVASIRRELSIPADSPVLGTVGMLIPEKDHLTFLRAAQLVIREWPRAVFLVVGSGPLAGSLAAEARRAGIDKNVRFVGFRSDVPALLHIMDVYVCSSISEGLSLSILEAMAAAKVVVATDVGGNPELVINDETGLLVPARDANALAVRVKLLLENEPLAREMGSSARQLVYRRFTLRHMIDSYEKLYHVAGDRLRKEPVADPGAALRGGAPAGHALAPSDARHSLGPPS